jgi:cytochrome c2
MTRPLRAPGGAHAATLALAALLALLGACDQQSKRLPRKQLVAGGDEKIGEKRFPQYGCTSCHVIPGVPGAHGKVGPTLAKWSERRLVAGTAPNSPEMLIRWIQEPQSIDPKTAMPNTGVTEQDARHMAAYLYTLH